IARSDYASHTEHSINSPVLEDYQYGFQDNVQVEPQRPIAQVIEIVVDPGLHLVEGAGLAAVAIDLGPAGDSGLDLVSNHITFYEVAVDFVVRHGMRAGADDAHAPLQHIDELGQLIERVPAQEGADAGNTGIALVRLADGVAIFAHAHRTEFIDEDLLAVEAVAALLENDGAGRIQLDGDGDEQQERSDQHQDEQREDDIACAL